MLGKVNGTVVYASAPKPEEFRITKAEYPSYVAMKIHEKYSMDDEIAIIRQKEEKPEEYEKYYEFCEKVKAEVKALIKE